MSTDGYPYEGPGGSRRPTGDDSHGEPHAAFKLQGGLPLVAKVCKCGHYTKWTDREYLADSEMNGHLVEMTQHPAVKAFWSARRDPAAVFDPATGIAKVLRWAAEHVDDFHGKWLHALADEIAGSVATQPTTETR